MSFVPIFSSHNFAVCCENQTFNRYYRTYCNDRCPSYSVNYADYVSHDLSLKDKDTVIMRNDLDDIQYEINLICGFFTVKFKSSYENDSYSHYSYLYKISKMEKNNPFVNASLSTNDENNVKILKVHNSFHIGCSHYEVEYSTWLFGISIKEMMTYYYYNNIDSLDKTEVHIIKKIINSSDSPNEKNIFGLYINRHFILCNKFNTSISTFSKQMVYFECGRPSYDKNKWFNNLFIMINKCVAQLLYFRVNETFKNESKKDNMFETPKMLVDCLKYELEQIKISNTTEENIHFVNICNRFISKIKKTSRHALKKIENSAENSAEDNVENSVENSTMDIVNNSLNYSVIPFVLDNVSSLDYKLRLLESTNIFTCFAIAFQSWNIGDSEAFLKFYDDLTQSYKYWFNFVKKIPKRYNKKSAFPIHNNQCYMRYHLDKHDDNGAHNRNSKQNKRNINALCTDEI